MMPEVDIARVIQLSVAPVFLLTGVAGLLNVLTHRLSRIIDRSRALESLAQETAHIPQVERVAESGRLKQRAKVVSRAIALATGSALMVCTVVMTLFVAAFSDVRAPGFVASLFVAAMALLIGALLLFLREIFVATENLRGPLK